MIKLSRITIVTLVIFLTSSFSNVRNCYLESDVDCVLFAVKTMIRSLSNKEIGLYAKRVNYFAEKSDG